MWDTQYFCLANNVDLHARSAKLHLSCYCDIVGRHSNLKYKNANVGGNGDHTLILMLLTWQLTNQLNIIGNWHWSTNMRWWSPNPNNSGYKLITHLWGDPQVSVRVLFSKLNGGCLSIWLIYCVALTISDLMAGVYKLVSCYDLKDVGQELKSVIHHAYKAE